MTAAQAEIILADLKAVEVERALRERDPDLAARVQAVKRYQQRRFSLTYADLLRSTRYGPASRFFLEELYGPEDYSARDHQFSRVVPALVRLFPLEVVETVAILSHLHALSERLDTALARALPDATAITPERYVRAWQTAARPADRIAQIELTLDVATRLDELTRRPLLRGSLRLMRRPAQAAGLGALQQFLESGFDTFRAMNGANEFLATVETRERALVASLFAADVSNRESPSLRAMAQALPPSDRE